MKILMGVASTTHVDRNNDKMTKECLEGMAEQIRKKITPLLIEHDLEQQIGVILYGEVFQLPDKEYALGTISAVFENDEERKGFEINKENTQWSNYQNYFDIEMIKNSTQIDAVEIQTNQDQLDEVADLLEKYFKENNIRREDGRFYEIKALVARHKGMRIVINSDDHNPPHFHVESIQRGFNARFYMESLEFMSIKYGDISQNEIRAIQKFFSTNPGELQKLKNTYSRLFPASKEAK